MLQRQYGSLCGSKHRLHHKSQGKRLLPHSSPSKAYRQLSKEESLVEAVVTEKTQAAAVDTQASRPHSSPGTMPPAH